MTGYYDGFNLSNTSTYNCVPCISTKCLTCPTAASVCALCNGLYRIAANNCACPATGYFDGFNISNTSTYNCVPCVSAKCATCPTAATTCATCNGLFRIATNNCACPTTGYYDGFNAPNSSTYDCVACTNPVCLACALTSPSVCDSCLGANRTTPNCACVSGFYSVYVAGNSSTYNCVTCPSVCLVCSSATVCSSCVGPTTGAAARLTPSCSCPVGYYSNLTASTACQSKEQIFIQKYWERFIFQLQEIREEAAGKTAKH